MKRLFVNLSAWLGFGVLLITATPVVSWYAKFLAGPINAPSGGTLVVLGGNELGPGLIGINTYWRAVYAVRAYRAGGFQKIILCGSGVASSMGVFLRSEGVPPEVIIEENRSRSTQENARYFTALLNQAPRPLVLLTSDYHMFRARRAFARCGVTVLPRPVPDAMKRAGQWSERLSIFWLEAGETAKIAYYWARGWI